MNRWIDPITMQVVGNFMRTAADEVEISMIRAAYSPIIKESFDCSAAILSPEGEFWALADAIPAQLGVLAEVQRNVLRQHAIETLEPGDILFTNDPFVGVPHLNDFVSIAPLLVKGSVLACVATLMHHTDVGGKAAGSMSADATEVYQEGIRLPVNKLVTAGGLMQPLLDVLLANSRTPRNFLGDLRAQIAASKLGIRRLQEAVQRFSRGRLLRHINAYLDYSEKMARGRVANVRPGVYTATRYVDNPVPSDWSSPIAISAEVTVMGDSISVDFSGSSDQVARPLNVVPSNGLSASLMALRCLLGSGIPMNGGIQRVISITCREGSIMNPILPAPVGARALTATLAFDCVLDCLGQAAPGIAVAGSSGGTTMPYVWAPIEVPGAPARIMIDNSLTGGTGARAAADGLSAIDNALTNAMNYPAEAIEQEYPVLVERHELRVGSAGAGHYRGGLGMRRMVRFLSSGVLSLRGHRYQFPPQGIFGGQSGLGSSFKLRRGGEEIPLPPQASSIPTLPGDVLIAETPGGGGYGDPSARNPQSIRQDLKYGLVTEDEVTARYGHASRTD